MAILIHLCRKDFAFAKHALWSAWAVFLATALMPVFMAGGLMEAIAMILSLLFAASLFLVFTSTLKILRSDSFTDGNSFISTRPLTKTMLWFSKIAGTAIFVLVPYLLAQVIGVLALSVHYTPGDWGLLLVENTLLFGMPAVIALIVGTHTRNFVWATMLTIVIAAAILWLGITISSGPDSMELFIAEGGHLKASQWLVAQALVCAAGILLAWLWIARRSLSWSIAAGVLALAVIAGVSTQWKANFVNRFALSDVDVNPTASDLRITWLGEPSLSGSSQKNVRYTRIFQQARVDGVPDGWMANLLSCQTIARFRDGGEVVAQAVNTGRDGDGSRDLLPSLGIELPLKHPRREDIERLGISFEIASSLLRDRVETNGTISGVGLVDFYQPVVLANLPAESGASAGHGRFRYRIEEMKVIGGAISAVVTVLGPTLSSKGDRQILNDGIELLLINPKTGEHSVIGYNSGSTSGGHSWAIMHRSLRIDDWPDRKTSDPQTFLKDARLYLIGRNYGGTVRVPFEMPEIDLKTGR